MEVNQSEKLQWPTYVPSVSQEPINSAYLRYASDQYNASGYSFNIKPPGENALMDPRLLIKFKIKIVDKVANFISSLFAGDQVLAGTQTANASYKRSERQRLCFRQGNVMQRSTQSIVATVNGFSLNAEPWKFIDPLNRLYVSYEESKHIFSASGGAFDSGNHGFLAEQDNYSYGEGNSVGANAAWKIAIKNEFSTMQPKLGTAVSDIGVAVTTGQEVSLMPLFPQHEDFYNPGFSDRIYRMLRYIRGSPRDGTQTGGIKDPTQVGTALATFQGTTAGTDLYSYEFIIWEPVPLPPFKMYANDNVVGMIPHVKDLIIRANFTPNMLANIFCSDLDISASFDMSWTNITNADCELYIKWFMPPANISLPMEISIPLRHIQIVTFSNITLAAKVNTNHVQNVATISQYNISLDAVPDLMLIYYRARLDNITLNSPSDYFFELQNLRLTLENNGGKLSQITTYQCYENYLKYLRHGDSQKPTYDEWRKYMFVACLRPEDYGIIKGPGYENMIVLGINADVYSYWTNPNIGRELGVENFATTNGELIVCSIYERWHLTLNKAGQGRANLTRIRDDNPASLPGPVPNMGASNAAASGLESLMAGLK